MTAVAKTTVIWAVMLVFAGGIPFRVDSALAAQYATPAPAVPSSPPAPAATSMAAPAGTAVAVPGGAAGERAVVVPAPATSTPTPTSVPVWFSPTPRPRLSATPADLFWINGPLLANTPQPSPTGSAQLGWMGIAESTPSVSASLPMPFFGEGVPASPVPPPLDVRLLLPPTPIAATGERQPLPAIPARMRISGPIGGSNDGQTSTRGRIGPTPPPIRYAGVPAVSAEASWLGPGRLWLGVPHRSQFDGTFYAETNCGPASLGMILEAYGLRYPTDAIRGEVNRFQGDANPDSGTSLGAVALVGQRAGLYPVGLQRRWSSDDVRAHLAAGRPIITLVRFADLPGNSGSDLATNHYIVLTGLAGDQFIYNDSAYVQGAGRGLLIPPDVLDRAWDNSVIPGQAVAFSLNSTGAGLLHPGRLVPPSPEAFGPDDDALDASLDLPMELADVALASGGLLLDPRDRGGLVAMASAPAQIPPSSPPIAAIATWSAVAAGVLLVLVASLMLVAGRRSRQVARESSIASRLRAWSG